MTHNFNVANNESNGTQGICNGMALKSGCSTHTRRINGMTVKCLYAVEVEHVLWEVKDEDSTTVVTKFKPFNSTSVKAKYPMPEMLGVDSHQKLEIKLKATQIPLISNNATTGHKLQSSSLDTLYIPSWSFDLNWPYVMISRVCTLNGLFLGKPLDRNKDFLYPESLLRMERRFRMYKSPLQFDYL